MFDFSDLFGSSDIWGSIGDFGQSVVGTIGDAASVVGGAALSALPGVATAVLPGVVNNALGHPAGAAPVVNNAAPRPDGAASPTIPAAGASGQKPPVVNNAPAAAAAPIETWKLVVGGYLVAKVTGIL